MRSSLSLCPLWALWVPETRFWGSWRNSDFSTFRNPAKVAEQVRMSTVQMQMGLSCASDPREVHFPVYLDPSAVAFMLLLKWLYRLLGLPWRLSCKKSACSAGNMGSIPESGRSPGEGNGNPLQCSCLGNPWTEEPGGLQSLGPQRVRHDLATKQPPHYYQSNL